MRLADLTFDGTTNLDKDGHSYEFEVAGPVAARNGQRWRVLRMLCDDRDIFCIDPDCPDNSVHLRSNLELAAWLADKFAV